MKFAKLVLAGIALLFSACGNARAQAPAIPWRLPAYSLTAREMPVRQALDTFSVAQGVPIVMSEAVQGVFSCVFTNMPAAEFLDRVATMHNFTWYYDGASLWVYASGEVTTTLIDLRYMKAGEVRAMLAELGVEDARFPIKTASNDELIMVSGPPRYVRLVAEMISKADKLREMRTFNEVETRLFPLVNTWADNVSFSVSGHESSATIRGVAYLLQEIMGTGENERTREGTNRVEKADELAESMGAAFRPVIRPENRLNAVLVRDAATRMGVYERLIRELDRPQKLVEIGVTVLEMSRNDALDWQLSLKVTGTHRDMEGGVAQNPDSLANVASLAGKGLAGAFTYLGRDVNVGASVSALREKGKARNVSRTSLLTLNNMAASLTDTQSYHARVVGTEVATLEEVSAGTRLNVKPRIVEPPAGETNASAQIWLTLELQDGGFETVSVDAMPMTRSSTLQTQAALGEGDSLLLAGYFRDIRETGGWGIPYLRDIPWIGWIFGGYTRNSETVQRLFILTPHVVDIAYYRANTQEVTHVQMLRQRDVAGEAALEDAADRADAARKDREERLRESQDARHEKDEESLYRNRKERALRKEMREDEREDDRKEWEKAFKERKDAYERAREEAREKLEKAGE